MVNDRGVISLSAKSLHFAIRRGLAQWNIQSVNPFAERIFRRGGYLMLGGHCLIIITLGMINSRIFQRWLTQIEGHQRSWLVVVSTQCLQWTSTVGRFWERYLHLYQIFPELMAINPYTECIVWYRRRYQSYETKLKINCIWHGKGGYKAPGHEHHEDYQRIFSSSWKRNIRHWYTSEYLANLRLFAKVCLNSSCSDFILTRD